MPFASAVVLLLLFCVRKRDVTRAGHPAAAGHEQEMTVYLTTDAEVDMEEICDRIAILHQGELRVVGKLEELLKRRDEVVIRMRSVTEEALSQIKGQVSNSGELLSVEHPTNTLEDLFLNVVRESG